MGSLEIMHNNGKLFIFRIFRHFLAHYQIKDKQIPNSYPQLPGKAIAYNKIVKNKFLAIENIPSIGYGKQRYDIFAKRSRMKLGNTEEIKWSYSIISVLK